MSARPLLFIGYLLLTFQPFTFVMAQDKPAYQLFDPSGKPTTYTSLLEKAATADVVLFGELHNNPICHWLQLELAQDLLQKLKTRDRTLIMGAEMFESDVQTVLNEYLSGLITPSHLETEGKVWSNYATDYAPLVELAKARQLRFIATNIPRRYASLVSKKGIDALKELPKTSKELFIPLKKYELDQELPAYAAFFKMMGGAHAGHGEMNALNFVHAQAIKDATMAYRINQNLAKNATMLHFNGDYHSKDFEGIGWHLKTLNPKLNVVTISSVEQANVNELDTAHGHRADFIICIPNTMTKTY